MVIAGNGPRCVNGDADQEGNRNEHASAGSGSSEPKTVVNTEREETNATPKHEPRVPRFFYYFETRRNLNFMQKSVEF